ncbi:MAG: DUF4893 domain-containing protein [Luteimonas sp.]|nr:DUF4893 domain-containing protein [Luteimonas sp.]
MHRRAIAMIFAATLLAGCIAPSDPPPAEAEPVAGASDTPEAPAPAPATMPAGDAPAPSGEAATTASCDWVQHALPGHRAQVETTPQALLQRFDAGSADAERLAALLERPLQPIGDITGAWQVRSLQLHMGQVYVYPYFEARIETDACGHRFAKTTGSQRRSGVLYPIEGAPDRLAFLGASTVNDDPPRAYDPARPAGTEFPGSANSAGWLARIGPDELLMVFDAEPGRFEAYHLRR